MAAAAAAAAAAAEPSLGAPQVLWVKG